MHNSWELSGCRCIYGVASMSRLLKLQVSFAEYSLFYRAPVQKRPAILRSLLLVATPYVFGHTHILSSTSYGNEIRSPYMNELNSGISIAMNVGTSTH